MRDIYDPPPARMTLETRSAPLDYNGRDLAWLGLFLALSFAAAWWAWTFEPMMWPTILVGGLFVALESWFSALTYLHRHPDSRDAGRWRIMLAAVVPWAFGLGLATVLMLGLFFISDHVG